METLQNKFIGLLNDLLEITKKDLEKTEKELNKDFLYAFKWKIESHVYNLYYINLLNGMKKNAEELVYTDKEFHVIFKDHLLNEIKIVMAFSPLRADNGMTGRQELIQHEVRKDYVKSLCRFTVENRLDITLTPRQMYGILI